MVDNLDSCHEVVELPVYWLMVVDTLIIAHMTTYTQHFIYRIVPTVSCNFWHMKALLQSARILQKLAMVLFCS